MDNIVPPPPATSPPQRPPISQPPPVSPPQGAPPLPTPPPGPVPEQGPTTIAYRSYDNPSFVTRLQRNAIFIVLGVIFLGLSAVGATFYVSSRNSQEDDQFAQVVTPTVEPTPTLEPIFVEPSPVIDLAPTTEATSTAEPTIVLTTEPTTAPTVAPTTSPETEPKTYTSAQYKYSFQYQSPWTIRNYGVVDSLTPDMVGVNAGSSDAILVAVKNTSYQDQIAVGEGSTEPITVGGISGTKKYLKTPEGTTTKIILPYSDKSLILVAKSGQDANLNTLLATFRLQ